MNIQEIFFYNMDRLLENAKFYSENSIFSNNKWTFNKKIAVGVSGGADSLSLAILSAQYADLNGLELYTYTVNHNLRKGSLEEALYVNQLLEKLGIKNKILHWEHDEIKFGHIEKEARNARYNLLMTQMMQDDVKILLTAHTENDLLETFLLRKIRKSKSFGLAGISAVRDLSCGMSLLRPFLNIPKKHLVSFLKNINVDWVHDPSNDDEHYHRVKIRKFLSKRERFCNLIRKKTNYYAQKRQKIEEDIYNFIQENVYFDKKLFFVKFDKTLFFNYQYSNELLQKLITLIGGSDYPVNLDFLNNKILNFNKFTAGRTVIEKSSDEIIIYRENKGINKTFQKNGFLFDNRLHVNFLHKESFCVDAIKRKGLEYLYDEERIQDLRFSFLKESTPAIFDSNGELLSAYFCGYSKDNLEYGEIYFAKKFIPFFFLEDLDFN